MSGEDFWNPQTFEGSINPFERFDTWQEFIDYYVTPKNKIERAKGPGNDIGPGEWYITIMSPKVMFLSYVLGTQSKRFDNQPIPNHSIKYIQVAPPIGHLRHQGKLNPVYFNRSHNSYWESGRKNNWSKDAILHYRVDFNKRLGMSLINWPNENPLEVKE